MDWVFENIQIVIALAAAVAYWLTNMKAAKEARQAEAEAEAAGREEVDEDVFGPDFDFGQPQEQLPRRMESGPPPLLERAPARPPQMPSFAQAAEAELARQNAMMERLRQFKDSREVMAGPPPAKARTARIARTARSARTARIARTVKTHGSSAAAAAAASAQGPLSLRGSLRNATELRKAIVLHEILGPPKALQD
jgi:hypothetical protein